MGARVAERRFPAELSAEPAAQELLSQVLEGTSVPKRTRLELELMLEELFVNVARYAYPDAAEDPYVDLRVYVDEETECVVVTIADEGVPFDPFDRPLPERPSSIEEAPIGGLGIVLVRKLSDAYEYRREDAMNKTRFAKLWGGARDHRLDRSDRVVEIPQESVRTVRLDDKELDGVVGGIGGIVVRPDPGMR